MTWTVNVENIAGIRSGNAELRKGRNVVRGANWQGKSSFLQAIETAVGTETPLTEGESSGRVELETPEKSYVVQLERRNDATVREGTPVLNEEYDRIRAELYAFLDESNAVRRAVRQGENLEEPLTRPLDFENIEERIADKKAERSSVEAELERAREAANRLPNAQESAMQLAEELDDLEASRDEIGGTGETETDGDREELSRLRAERSRADQRIERLIDAIERIEGTLAEVRTEYDDVSVPEEDVAAELAEVREKREAVRSDVDLLQSVYSANKRLLEEGRVDLLADVEHGLVADEIDCWLCGSTATEDAFHENLDRLSARITDLKAEAAEHAERADELAERQDAIREAERRRDDLEHRIDDLEAKAGDRRESLESATGRREEIDGRIDELEEVVAEHGDELAEIKSEIKRTKTDLEETQAELEDTERQADRRPNLEGERERLGEEIETLRNRKQEMKRQTREAFDDAIGDLLERFDTSFETARLTSTFDLVVARNGRKANIDALSEGELELLGIVAALAGHEAFEVSDSVPILLLDQLGGLSEGNMATLIDYMDDRTEFLVFTAYPEHGTFDGNVIDPSDWDIVTKNPEATA